MKLLSVTWNHENKFNIEDTPLCKSFIKRSIVTGKQIGRAHV